VTSLAGKIQLRSDTAANWAAENPILAAGEAGCATDTRTLKIGDGATAWNDLPSLVAVPTASPTFLCPSGVDTVVATINVRPYSGIFGYMMILKGSDELAAFQISVGIIGNSWTGGAMSVLNQFSDITFWFFDDPIPADGTFRVGIRNESDFDVWATVGWSPLVPAFVLTP
jgi:hypothetical protein